MEPRIATPRLAIACLVVSLLAAACSGAGREEPNAAVVGSADFATPARVTGVLDGMAKQLGAGLYRDYRAGRTQAIHVTQATRLARNGTASYAGPNENSCHLYQDEDARTDATAPANARYVGCSVRWYSAQASDLGDRVSDYRHAFVLVPDTQGGFALRSRARQMLEDCRPDCRRLLGSSATQKTN